MKIHATHLTLRFYKRDGWTKKKVHDLLIDKTLRVIEREDTLFPESSYYAVYDNSGYKTFSKELIWHEFDNPNNYNIDWYIKK